MAMTVHECTELLNLQNVFKSTDLRVYIKDLSCRNTDMHSPSVFQEEMHQTSAVVTCLQTYY